MIEYVFVTNQGNTESPNGDMVENQQVLGYEFGKDLNAARQNLISNNPWIIDSGYDIEEIIGYQIIR